MIRPFISSEGNWITEIVFSMASSAEKRSIELTMISRASRLPRAMAWSLISLTLRAANCRALSSNWSMRRLWASGRVIPAISSRCC